MGTERGNFFIEVGDTKIGFQGAKWWYTDNDIQTHTGVKTRNDAGQGQNEKGELTIESTDAKKYLVKLRAVLAGQVAQGVGQNQQQSDRTRSFDFYCDPDKVEEAMTKLPNKNVDRGAGLGNFNINKVYRPRRRVYI